MVIAAVTVVVADVSSKAEAPNGLELFCFGVVLSFSLDENKNILIKTSHCTYFFLNILEYGDIIQSDLTRSIFAGNNQNKLPLRNDSQT